VRVHGGLAYVSGHGPFAGDGVLLTSVTPAAINGSA
jgi:hypothetical protein